MDETIEYREIPGHPGYRAGSDGTIWSQWNFGPANGQPRGAWHEKRQCTDSLGYRHVRLRSAMRKSPSAKVHRLILLAFVGAPPLGKPYGCHNDGNPSNNAIRNLRWASQAENLGDMRRHGTLRVGIESASAKLSEADVREIRRLRSGGRTMRSIALAVGTSAATVCNVINGHRWRHVA